MEEQERCYLCRTLLHVPESYRDSNDDPKSGLMSSRVSTKMNALYLVVTSQSDVQ